MLQKNNENIAVILLVGGYSSRMQSLKALLPFAESFSLVTHCIELFQKAGIENMYVVLGYEFERIQSHILEWEKTRKGKKTCRIVFNTRFDEGMYSSVCAGISALMEDSQEIQTENIENNKNKKNKNINATFLMPVDAVLVQEKTIKNMLKKEVQANSIIIPTFLEKCGHPPLITKEHFSSILEYEKSFYKTTAKEKFRGLQGYFTQFLTGKEQGQFLKGLAPKTQKLEDINCEADTIFKASLSSEVIQFLPFADEGILCDVDTPEEYKHALELLSITESRDSLSLLESWHILTHNELTDRIIKHSYKVGLGAFRLYVQLQKQYKITENDLLTCFCGGLLHDICRLEKHHAEVGGEFIEALGYKKIAAIIKAHTNLPKKIVHELDMFIANYTVEKEEKALSLLESFQLQNNLIQDNSKNRILKNSKNEIVPSIKQAFLPILCVHLADKFYAGEEFIGMQKRFEFIKERFIDDEKALKAIKKRQEIAIKTAYWFYCETNCIAEECAETPNNHIFEKMMHEQYIKL